MYMPLTLFLIIILLYLCYCRENYRGEQSPQYCSNCGGRIVTAAVYADPNNDAGLGWIL